MPLQEQGTCCWVSTILPVLRGLPGGADESGLTSASKINAFLVEFSRDPLGLCGSCCSLKSVHVNLNKKMVFIEHDSHLLL